LDIEFESLILKGALVVLCGKMQKFTLRERERERERERDEDILLFFYA